MEPISAEAKILHLEQQVLRLEQKLVAAKQHSEALQHKLLARTSIGSRASHSGADNAMPDLARLSIDSNRLASEKADLENALEAEQEYIMHKLHQQLDAVKQDKEHLRMEKQQLKSKVKELNSSVQRLCQEKVDLERSLEMEEEAFVNSLCRQVASVMENYKAMDQVMHKHGIRIMPVTPQSPRPVLRRTSAASQSADTSTPSTSARGSPIVRSTQGRGIRQQSTRRDAPPPGGSNSPGASLHATREHLEALSRSGVLARHALRSDDSMSSMGSMMSAISRDPSVTRESLSSLASSAVAGGHPSAPPSGPQSGPSSSVPYPAVSAADGRAQSLK